MRPFCKACAQRPRAINYHKNNRAYYRTLCEICLAHGAGAHVPRWQRAGYKPKPQCEKCGITTYCKFFEQKEKARLKSII